VAPNRRTYIETSVVSYLTAWPSRDLVRAAHQQVTREWWATRASFELHISQFVLDEAAAGDAVAAAERLEALRDLPLLDVTEDVILLATELVAGGGLPAKARVDALHVAVATVHGMDFLLTWNCTHIANAATRGTIEELCRAAGFEPPIICTPLELSRS
jgi:predicted nucleic acid-binding protein